MTARRSDRARRALARGEHSRRRITVLAIALLLAFGTSPVYVTHVFESSAAQVLAGMDHLGALCLTALHLLLQPVHHALRVLVLAGLAWALWDRLHAWCSARATLERLEQRQPSAGDPFWRAATAVGADPRGVRIVAGLPNPAFTAGLLAPRVYLAEELAVRLTPEQLEAVIAHEAAHASRRDPLRLFLLRLLRNTLFWMPALARLADDVADDAEVRADDVAARGRPLVLASAILAISAWGMRRATPAGAVGFERDALLEHRIRRLAGEDMPARSHVTRRSVAGAALALSLVWASGGIMAHPLPAPDSHTGSATHCSHDGESAVAHLFCLGRPFSGNVADTCPHHTH